jgi:hypothetical protein
MGCDQAKAAQKYPTSEADKAQMTEPFCHAKGPLPYLFILSQIQAVSWKRLLLLLLWIIQKSTILRWFAQGHQIHTS